MALTYNNASLKFANNFEVNTTEPLDTRLVVDSISDLTNGSIKAPYKGMVVNIAGTSQLYVFTSIGIAASKLIENWVKVSGTEVLNSLTTSELGKLTNPQLGFIVNIKNTPQIYILTNPEDYTSPSSWMSVVGVNEYTVPILTEEERQNAINDVTNSFDENSPYILFVPEKSVNDDGNPPEIVTTQMLKKEVDRIDKTIKDLDEKHDNDVDILTKQIITSVNEINKTINTLEKKHDADVSQINDDIDELTLTHKTDVVGLYNTIGELESKHDEDLKSAVGDLTNLVNNLRDEIYGGSDIVEAYDTLQEIGKWIEEHQDLYEALVNMTLTNLQTAVNELKTLINNSLYYVSNAEDDWLTEKVGGIDGGLSKSDFEGKTFSDLFDMILYPTLQPTVTQPTSSIIYNGNSTNGQVLLVQVGSNLPVETAFTGTQTKGSVSYKNAVGTKDYTGDYTVSLTMNPNNFGGVSSETTYTVTRKVTYEAGPKLLDNKGGASTVSSYPGGSLSNTKVFHCVSPIYINTSSIDTMTSQGLKDYIAGTTISVTIPAESSTDKLKIHVPSSVSTLTVKQLNKTNNQYDINWDMIKTGTTTYDSVVYNTYVRTNVSTDTLGVASYQITIRK